EPAKVRVTIKNSPSSFVKGLLTAIVQFAGWDLTVEEPIVREGEIYINMEGSDAGLIIGKRANTLNALQLLVQSAVAKHFPQSIRVVLDVSKYRERRRAAIIQLALNAADKARTQKRLVRLRNLTAAERRVVHMTLQSDPTVFTLSEGEGENRVVIVAPMEMRDRLLKRQRTPQRRSSQKNSSSQNKTENTAGMTS
ncbi:MAG: R3H domain-containing nucleic acid-binding protein, partial [Armatimonadota bacterium]